MMFKQVLVCFVIMCCGAAELIPAGVGGKEESAGEKKKFVARKQGRKGGNSRIEKFHVELVPKAGTKKFERQTNAKQTNPKSPIVLTSKKCAGNSKPVKQGDGIPLWAKAATPVTEKKKKFEIIPLVCAGSLDKKGADARRVPNLLSIEENKKKGASAPEKKEKSEARPTKTALAPRQATTVEAETMTLPAAGSFAEKFKKKFSTPEEFSNFVQDTGDALKRLFNNNTIYQLPTMDGEMKTEEPKSESIKRLAENLRNLEKMVRAKEVGTFEARALSANENEGEGDDDDEDGEGEGDDVSETTVEIRPFDVCPPSGNPEESCYVYKYGPPCEDKSKFCPDKEFSRICKGKYSDPCFDDSKDEREEEALRCKIINGGKETLGNDCAFKKRCRNGKRPPLLYAEDVARAGGYDKIIEAERRGGWGAGNWKDPACGEGAGHWVGGAGGEGAGHWVGGAGGEGAGHWVGGEGHGYGMGDLIYAVETESETETETETETSGEEYEEVEETTIIRAKKDAGVKPEAVFAVSLVTVAVLAVSLL
ncbi:MAG: uncharacterized protein A8A55_0663 [Amphiamblys sp. WSBS2006]|nr:MAG: uncharacterized protein A8A55_0663 [Amphiamblys sp. WSBS2006]